MLILCRWCTTWLKRVEDKDKAEVAEAVNALANHLNALAMSSSG